MQLAPFAGLKSRMRQNLVQMPSVFDSKWNNLAIIETFCLYRLQKLSNIMSGRAMLFEKKKIKSHAAALKGVSSNWYLYLNL
jgi:hypothetical protein